jgi:hypothetical protein
MIIKIHSVEIPDNFIKIESNVTLEQYKNFSEQQIDHVVTNIQNYVEYYLGEEIGKERMKECISCAVSGGETPHPYLDVTFPANI